MRRWRFLATAVGAILLLTALLGASVVLAGPSIHQVTGGGTYWDSVTDQYKMVAFSAQIDGSEAVKGQAQFRSAEQTTHVRIDCLAVSGISAWLSGIVTWSSNPAFIGEERLWRVTDTGEGASTGPDYLSEAALGNCLTPSIPVLMKPLTYGNVQVR